MIHRRLLLPVIPVALAFLCARAEATPTPVVSQTQSGPCVVTQVPATTTTSLTFAGAVGDPFVDVSSPASGTAGLNCTQRFVADVQNGIVVPPPAPLQNWLTSFTVQGVHGHVPVHEAECTALKLDSELWGEKNGQWTHLFFDHKDGKWSGASCEPPSIEHVIWMPPKGTGYDRYRVVATNGGQLRVIARIVGPKPTLTRLQMVAANGGASRPSAEIQYAGEPLRLSLTGNVDNKEGTAVCFYSVVTEHLATKHRTVSHFNRFTVQSLPALPELGDHRLTAEARAEDPLPHCEGKLEHVVRLHDARAPWIMDMALQGFGYRFPAGDAAGMPQFCDNCTSIFSPAHNIGLLRITPVIQLGDGKTGCHYSIDQKFDDDVRPGDGYYSGKGSVLPTGTYVIGPAGLTWDVKYSESPPFLNRWNNRNNHVTVTIRGSSTDPGYPACNIGSASAALTKTISFTDNEKAAPVNM